MCSIFLYRKQILLVLNLYTDINKKKISKLDFEFYRFNYIIGLVITYIIIYYTYIDVGELKLASGKVTTLKFFSYFNAR